MANAEQVARDGSTNEESGPALYRRRLSSRGFFKIVAGAVASIAAMNVVGRRIAQATYTTGSPSDIVDTNLNVQGNLIVDQNVGIGTSTPAGKLDVAGALYSTSAVAVDGSGSGKQSYYVGGATQATEPSLQGTWRVAANHTWAECTANGWTWAYLATLQQ